MKANAKRANQIKMKRFVYGQANNHGAYAVSVVGDKVWSATEFEGLFYTPCDFDEIPEDNWDRISALEEKVS